MFCGELGLDLRRNGRILDERLRMGAILIRIVGQDRNGPKKRTKGQSCNYIFGVHHLSSFGNIFVVMAVSVLIVAPVVPRSLDDDRLAVNPLCSFFRTRGDRLRRIRGAICTLAHTAGYMGKAALSAVASRQAESPVM